MCWRTSFPASMSSSAYWRSRRMRRTVPLTPMSASTESSASSTSAGSAGTTRSSTAGTPCSSCPMRSVGVTLEQWWKCSRGWTELFGCSTKGASSHRRRLHRVPAHPAELKRRSAIESSDENGHLYDAGSRWKIKYAPLAARSTTRNDVTGCSSRSTCCAGSPTGDRELGGRRSIAPSLRAYPPGESPEAWE